MKFGGSVHARRQRRKGKVTFAAPRRAFVRVVVGDAFGTFVREAALAKPWRVTLVSPWISGTGVAGDSLERVLRHVERCSAALVVITRHPKSHSHANALERVARVPRSTILYNPNVHAKLYISEEADGRGLAVIGSGNATDSSRALDEASVLIRPLQRSGIIQYLGSTTIRQLGGAARSHSKKTGSGRST